MKFWPTWLLGAACGATLTVAAFKLMSPPAPNGTSTNGLHPIESVAVDVDVAEAAPGREFNWQAQHERAQAEMKAQISADLDGKIQELLNNAGSLESRLGFEEQEAILELWAKKDPYGCLEAINHAPRFQRRMWALGFGLAEIGRNDQPAASLWLVQNVMEADRNEAAEQAVLLLAKDSPEQDVVFAEADGYGVDLRYFNEIFQSWAAKDPQAALQGFGTMGELGQKRVAATLAQAWATEDFATARAWVQSGLTTEWGQESLRGLVLAGIDAGNPEVAELLKQLPEESARELLQNRLWQEDDKGQNLLSLLTGTLRSEALRIIAVRDFERNPDEALSLVQNEPLEQRVGALQFGFEVWTRSDRKAAMAWLNALGDAPLKATLLAQVEREKATLEPVKTIAALAGGEASAQNISQFSAALSKLAERHPQGAAEQISQNPALVETGSARYIAGEYFLRDEEGAAAWLATLPAGEVKDAALFSAATFWAGKGEQEFAAHAMASMRSPEARTQTQVQIYSEMLVRNPTQAEKWLAAQPMSEEARAVLRVVARRDLD